MRYRDIIDLEDRSAAYSIANERADDWKTFIPHEQFNKVLHTVAKSVRKNNITEHKSFWIEGTYGTGKSHAVAVISHILGDPVESIEPWIEREYKGTEFDSLRQKLYDIREKNRLLTVKISGLCEMTHASDLCYVLQKAVKRTLAAHRIDLQVSSNFEFYINHIREHSELWASLISNQADLGAIVGTCDDLISKLQKEDLGTFHRVTKALRATKVDIRPDRGEILEWLSEIQTRLSLEGPYTGLLIVWDEFTDVMVDPVGISVLKELQEIVEKFNDIDSSSYFFLISHPSAFNNVDSEQRRQTDGRYHRMSYNMGSVSAFKIMSRMLKIKDEGIHNKLTNNFYSGNTKLLDVFSEGSNDLEATKLDLRALFPIHPGTANLAAHYATVIGSSSRSVFEFIGQNDAIRSFLDSRKACEEADTITADYLWDYVLKVFQDDVTRYAAVTERFNSYMSMVEHEGEGYSAVFKGILLLNAFNNVSGENNRGLVTPSEENIGYLFQGTRYQRNLEEILAWFNERGIIQRAPGGLYSVQFASLPAGEIEEKKREMRDTQYSSVDKILDFGNTAQSFVEKYYLQSTIRPYRFKFYSNAETASTLLSKVRNEQKKTSPCSLFFSLLFAKNKKEENNLRDLVESCICDSDDNSTKNVVFLIFHNELTNKRYERFIEYMANLECARNHALSDQVQAYTDYAASLITEWLKEGQRSLATLYVRGKEKEEILVRDLQTKIDYEIAPYVFCAGPDACDLLRKRAPKTFWKPQHSKEIARIILSATSKEAFVKLTSQMRPVQYLVQDCLDDNLEWKDDAPPNHPFKLTCEEVERIIKHADKSRVFNFNDKFAFLSKPPYGFFGCFATIATLSFALRPWSGRIFDPQGKPRRDNELADDIIALFKVWDSGKADSKLNFKFQTVEEGKLCRELISLFSLNSKGNDYSAVTSLKDARYAITGDYLKQKRFPLWSIKYAPDSLFEKSGSGMRVSEPIKELVDNIVKICTESDLRNPSLVKNTLDLIAKQRIDFKNILNVDSVFEEGFYSFLMQIEKVGIQSDEVDSVSQYVSERIQQTIGLWSEEKVTELAKDWRLEQSAEQPSSFPQPSVASIESPSYRASDTVCPLHTQIEEKRSKAKQRVERITSLEEAKSLLMELCGEGNELILDKINSH